jgi:toxin HigB-1
MAILSFADKETERFYATGKTSKRSGWAQVKKAALRKLDMVEYAKKLQDLKVPPNNRLEKLSGDLKGFYSIRINDQWRIVFRWSDKGASQLRILDYHS